MGISVASRCGRTAFVDQLACWAQHPNRLEAEISALISNYVKKAERPIILIDGLEYLVSRFEFNPVYQFLQTKRSQIERTGSILIITVFKDALDAREVRLLEREFQLFS